MNIDTQQHLYELFYLLFIRNSNMTFFFRFVNKRASYPFGIISLAHAPVNVTRIIQSLYYAPAGRYINSSSDSADRGRSIIRVT